VTTIRHEERTGGTEVDGPARKASHASQVSDLGAGEGACLLVQIGERLLDITRAIYDTRQASAHHVKQSAYSHQQEHGRNRELNRV
jgi:hypothetical protein